ncbi:MAG TPA: MFS transporter [Spongiibacteraceae bacterium]|nr:MFS transporter [Spongiibacteraceae bacterium]
MQDHKAQGSILTRSRPPLWLLMMLGATSPLSLLAFIPALPVLSEEFSVGLGTVQWVITGVLLAVGTMQLVIGPAVDRLGRKPVLVLGISAFAVASFFATVVTDIEWVIICRVLQGVSVAALSVVSRAAVHDIFKGVEAARAMSFVTLALQVPGFAAPAIGGVLVYYLGWQALFVFLGAYALVLLALVLWLMPETRPDRQPGKDSQHAAGIGVFLDYGRLIGNLQFTAYAAILALCAAAAMAISTVLPSALSALGLSPDQIGYFTSAGAVASVSGAALAAQLVVRLGVNRLMLGALILVLVYIAGYMSLLGVAAISVANLFLLFLVISACQSIVISMGFAEALRADDSLRGVASGLAGSSASIVSAMLAGVAASVFSKGIIWSLAVILGCFLCALLLAWVMRSRRMPMPSEAS